jgi:hypothetical protein
MQLKIQTLQTRVQLKVQILQIRVQLKIQTLQIRVQLKIQTLTIERKFSSLSVKCMISDFRRDVVLKEIFDLLGFYAP